MKYIASIKRLKSVFIGLPAGPFLFSGRKSVRLSIIIGLILWNTEVILSTKSHLKSENSVLKSIIPQIYEIYICEIFQSINNYGTISKLFFDLFVNMCPLKN